MRTVPDIKMPLPGPKAAAIVARDNKYVSPSYTRDYPFVMARGEGAVVEDVDGNVFLDCAAGIAVNSTGHAHPDVVRAITEQAQKYLHMSGTDFYYEPQVQARRGDGDDRARSAAARARSGRSSATPAPRPIEAAHQARAVLDASASTSSRFWVRFTAARWARCPRRRASTCSAAASGR